MARRKLASATSATSPAYPDWHGTSQSDSSPRKLISNSPQFIIQKLEIPVSWKQICWNVTPRSSAP